MENDHQDNEEEMIHRNYIALSNLYIEMSDNPSREGFAYKEVSEMSDVTEENYPEGLEMLKDGAKDLETFDKLME